MSSVHDTITERGYVHSAESRQKMSKRRHGLRPDNSPATGWFLHRDGYKMLTGNADHPLADKSGNVAEHRVVLYAEIGAGPHSCHWGCGRTDLQWANGHLGLNADHVNGDVTDNRPDNLVPSCMACNLRRGKAGNPTDWHADQIQTHCVNRHPFDAANTYTAPKSGKRSCRTCHRNRQAQRAVRKRVGL